MFACLNLSMKEQSKVYYVRYAPKKEAQKYTAASKPKKISVLTQPEASAFMVGLGEYTLTAYCPCVKCCGVWSKSHASRKGSGYVQKTASGTIPKAGRTVGVDPNIIPYGTEIYIDGHGWYVAEDTGSAIKNKKNIDIYMTTHSKARAFGKQKAEIFTKWTG